MRISIGMILVTVAMTLSGAAADPSEIRVAGERINLRARPMADAEVVAQVGTGDVLSVTRSDGDWLAVRAPTNAGVWVKAEFVKAGISVSERLNIRCGPGLSYRDVGVVRKGDHMTIVEVKGDWLRIVPPKDLVLWVNRSVVAPVNTGKPSVEVAGDATGTVIAVTAETSVPTAATPADQDSKYPVGVTGKQLAPVLGQGAVIERTGVMERVPLAFVRGVEFRLVERVDGRSVTVCYVRGDEPSILSLMGQPCKVKGRGYWLNGERVPLIYCDSITASTGE
jgi:SH3-like domain-containing protein